MGRLPETPEKKRQQTIHLIKTTEELLEQEGYEATTIRAISKKAKCNSAALYRYFEDFDELLLFASIKYFREYFDNLVAYENLKQTDPRKYYLTSWSLFAQHTFLNPDTSYQLLFGKHSQSFDRLAPIYFDLFPEEDKVSSVHLLAKAQAKSLKDLTLDNLTPVLKDSVSQETIHRIADLTVAYLQLLLTRRCLGDRKEDVQPLVDKMVDVCTYLLDTAK